MRYIVSKQALIYLLDNFSYESEVKLLPYQKDVTKNQIEKMFSIIKSASTKIYGKVLYVSLIEKVSHIIYVLNKQHVLTDGNKRFSLLVAVYLLEGSYSLVSMSSNDWEMLIMRIASDHIYTKEDVVEYLKEKLEG
jgi:prophage maintenance system killer protein